MLAPILDLIGGADPAQAALAASFLPSWMDPTELIRSFVSWLGPFAIVGVCAVVFAETGLMVGFFLPGDSLLFTLGVFVGTGDISTPVPAVIAAIMASAIVGDQTGYWIGRTLGPKVFDKEDSRLFKRAHVDKTNAFFEKYGGRTIVLAQFVPIVRTFAPVAAGVGRMNYRHFVTFNVVAAAAWGAGVPLLGIWLGGYQMVRDHIEFILVAVVLISAIPMAVEAVRARRHSGR